jgi:hypothetical protein
MQKNRLLFLIIGSIFSGSVIAQSSNTKIAGTISDPDNKPINNAEISIQNACNESAMQIRSNDIGYYEITVPACGKHRIICISAGFDTLVQEIASNGDSLLAVNLTLSPLKIKAAEIATIKNAITLKGDKIIVDADAVSPGAAATALDLLVRCPGVIVDEQNNLIQMKGKAGVMIMVNDRLLQMGGIDLFNWLRSQPAAMVDKVELISNPSARYDASGMAGIINLKLKRNKQEGTSGSLTSGAGQGRYGKLSEGINVNYKKNNVAVTSIYNYALRKGFNELNLTRDFRINDTFIGGYEQRNYLRLPVNSHAFRTSMDVQTSQKFQWGTSINGNATFFKPNGKNYSNTIGADGNLASYFSTVNDSKEQWYNGAANAYLKVLTDTLGGSLTTDIDVAGFGNISDQLFTTEYFDKLYLKSKPDYLLAGDQQGLLKILAFKSDYVKPTAKGRQFEVGIKASSVIADNNLKFFDQSLGVSILDTGKTNHFIYKENIVAAYTQVSGSIKNLIYQTGLRFEQTIANGNQNTSNQNFKKIYGQFFPTITLQKILKSGNITGITLTRRIERPSYNDLNPFKFYLDPTTYKAGNPDLNPHFSWIADMQFVFAKGSSMSLSMSHTDHMITEVLYPSENDPKITIQTNKNLNTFQSVIFSANTPLKLGKKSNGFWSMNAGYQFFKGMVSNSQVSKGSPVMVFTGSQALAINSHYTADMSATFQSGQVYAFMYLKTLGQLGLGLQRNFWNKTGTLKLNLTDVFFTGNPKGINDFVGYHEEFVVKRETRMAMLTFNWKFGSPQGPAKRRSGGAEEEKKRASEQIG